MPSSVFLCMRLCAFVVLALLSQAPEARAAIGSDQSDRPVQGDASIRGPQITLRADPTNAHTAVRAPARAGKSAPATAMFVVEYVGFPEEAREAFQYAVDVWSTLVESAVPIHIRAVWTTLDLGTLGSAGATYLFSDFGAGLPNTWYPSALADAIAGADQNPGEADIVASFNSIFPNWHFGTTGKTPTGTYDFVSVVMHEIGHGLGFAGSMWMDDGVGEAECDGVAGHACWGYPGFAGTPETFDRHVRDAFGSRLIENPPYPNPSAELGMTLLSGNITFDGPAAVSANGGAPVLLYAPPSWQSGSSYSHLDEATFGEGDPSSLMTPMLAMAELVHDPGPIGCGVLADIGWTVTPACGNVVPPVPPPSAPVAAWPANGALDVVLGPVLVWHSSAGAVSYELRIHRLEDQAVVLDESALVDTSFAVSGLEEDTWYGWNVRAWNDTEPGAWSDTSSFLTRVSEPEVVTGLTPPDGAADVALSPVFAWQPAGRAAFYRVELTEAAPPSVRIFAADSVFGTTVVPIELATNTDYRWRVQAVNRAGASDWSTPATFRTIPDPPPAPDLVGPMADATEPRPVILRWTQVADADSYRVQYSYNSPIPDAAPLLQTTADSLVLDALDPDRDVYWRVRAGNEGGWSRWSRTRAFHTAEPAPGAPSLVTPADEAEIHLDVVSVAWEPVDGAETYDVELASDAVFAEIVAQRLNLPEPSTVVDALVRDRWYHWRVRASNPGGDGPWSSARRFFLMPFPPVAPELAGPAEGHLSDSASIALTWQAPLVTRFHVQIATDAEMTIVIAEDSLLDAPAYHFAATGPPGTRFWRVRGYNAAGWGEWSDVRSFEMAYVTTADGGGRNSFALEPNYPNPFAGTTHISFTVRSPGHARLLVSDLLGRTVAILVDDVVTAGRHEVVFDAGAVATGTYFCRLESGGASTTRVMHVVR